VAQGETYKICCPFCNDRGFRLEVPYLFGCPDPEEGSPLRHLAHCFNEGCLSSHFGDIWRAVIVDDDPFVDPALEAEAAPPPEDPLWGAAEPPPAPWPGECVPLDELPADDDAVLYLRARRFDPDALARTWGVRRCLRPDTGFLPAGGRIVIPVFDEGELRSWQARYTGDIDWKAAGIPKYWNLPGGHGRRWLYGREAAEARSPRLVLACEGPLDVWAAGPGAVALQGKSVTPHQLEALSAWAARGGLLVLALDATAWTKAEWKSEEAARRKRDALLATLRSAFAGRVVEMNLPGKDLAALPRGAVWPLVEAACWAAGHPPGLYGGTPVC
jgi:hypothetical protein